MEHWFWLILTVLTLVWYLVVTIVVGIRGASDIKEMLKSLSEEKEKSD